MGSVTLVFGQFAVHTGWDEWSSCAVGAIVRFVIFSTVRTDRGLFCRAIVGIVVVFLTDVTPLYVKVNHTLYNYTQSQYTHGFHRFQEVLRMLLLTRTLAWSKSFLFCLRS